jgi:hypothetical protein
MGNDILNLPGSLSSSLDVCLTVDGVSPLELDALYHLFHDVLLADILLTLALKLLHNCDDHEGSPAELIKGDLDLLASVSTRVLLSSTWHLKVLLLLSLAHNLSLLIDLILNLSEFDVALDDVNVGGTHQAANFSHIHRFDFLITVSASHALTQTDQRLKLTDSDLVGRSTLGILLVLPHTFELLLEHLSCLLGELRLNGSAELDISLELLGREGRVQGILLQSVHLDDVIGDVNVIIITLLIENDEEEVETRHDRCRDVHVEAKRSGSVVAAIDWVGCSQD